MKKRVVVISLGGSLIIPDKVNVKFLTKFKKTILQNTKKNKFVIVCGGGGLARRYISAIKQTGANQTFQSFAGIAATRTNARFVSYFFGEDQQDGIPHTIDTLKKYLRKKDTVFCGALEYKPRQTSDSTAAQIANILKADFINLTNIKGLYTKNPLKHKDARFISEISWNDFDKMANKLSFKPGQHFVLDQTASATIKKHKIPTYILGQNVKNLDKLLKGKKFVGTQIEG